jgi:ribosomal protein S18 acetylase RimI-like enzyme
MLKELCSKCGLPGKHSFPCQTVKLISHNNENYNLFWGGYKSSLVVGKVKLFKNNTTLYFSDFVINNQYRRQGFATKALKEINRIAKEKQCSKIKLLVLPENSPAISLYEKNGFDKTGMKSIYFVYEKSL